MQAYWIVSLVVFILMVVFAAQNTDPVPLKFLSIRAEPALFVLVFASAAAGAVIVFFLNMPRRIRAWRQLNALRDERDALRTEHDAAVKRIKEVQDEK